MNENRKKLSQEVLDETMYGAKHSQNTLETLETTTSDDWFTTSLKVPRLIWRKLKAYCAERGLRLQDAHAVILAKGLGDTPITRYIPVKREKNSLRGELELQEIRETIRNYHKHEAYLREQHRRNRTQYVGNVWAENLEKQVRKLHVKIPAELEKQVREILLRKTMKEEYEK